MAFVDYNTNCTHCGGLLDSNGNCISCEKALRERYKYTVDPRLIRMENIKKRNDIKKRKKEGSLLRSDLSRLFRFFILLYIVILFIAFVAAAISYRYNTELLNTIAIVVVSCTIFILIIRFIFEIISKSIFSFLIFKFIVLIFLMFGGILLPLSVYSDKSAWIFIENIFLLALIIPLLYIIFFVARSPTAAWFRVGDGAFVRHASSKESEIYFGKRTSILSIMIGLAIIYYLFREMVLSDKLMLDTVIEFIINYFD